MNKKIKKIKNKDEVIRYLWRKLAKKGLFNSLSDERFLKLEYYIKMGHSLDLEDPRRYNEKLQWLKLNNRKPLLTNLVDKYEVREFVGNIIGKEFLVPIYGVYDTYEEIDFHTLPERFVLKPTHTSGDVYICNNKIELNEEKLKKETKTWLNKRYFNYHREWPYQNIKPRLICEKNLIDAESTRIKDFKFFCFNGNAEYMYVASDRGKDLKFDFYDMDFNHLNVQQHYPKSEKGIPKPDNFDEMVKIAEKLSKGFSHVRVDLYSINKKIFFGEYTFFHMSGYEKFVPDEFDYTLGELLKLPSPENAGS